MTPLKNMQRVIREVELLNKVGFTAKFEHSGIVVYKTALNKYKDVTDFAYYNSFDTVEEFLAVSDFILNCVCSSNTQKIEMLQEMAAKKIERYEDD